eukprot:gene3971-7227_t
MKFSKGLLTIGIVGSLSFGGYFQLKNPYSTFHQYSILIFNRIEPEISHKFIEIASKLNLLPKNNFEDERLKISFEKENLHFKNPIGLAAGFDKNAILYQNLKYLGFSFIEIGSICPKAQSGNPKPRIFKYNESKAIINRCGFNSDGIDKVKQRLEKKKNDPNDQFILGINLGKNKSSPEGDASDYLRGIKELGHYSNYITINISSPNTPNLRKLQNFDNLTNLLNEIKKENIKNIPIFVKIAPDMKDDQLKEISEILLNHKVTGAIISNTTINHEGIGDKQNEVGGLSGKPLFKMSTNQLRKMYSLTNGKIILIGVGGVFSGKDVYEKMKSGASLVQIYTGLIYEGPKIVPEIKKELIELLNRDGIQNIQEIVGSDVKKEKT